MILTRIEDCSRYEQLNPEFRKVFEYIRSADFSSLPEGVTPIGDGKLTVNHIHPAGKSRETQLLEAHRRYIDIHMPIDTCETIGWKPTGEIRNWTSPYDEDGDCALSAEKPATYFELRPGDIAIVWPEDAHAPAISESRIHKVIFKIPV